MLITITAEHKQSPILRALKIMEDTGDIEFCFIDSSDEEVLKDLYEQLEAGLSFADFQIIKSKTEDNLETYELRHFCTNISPNLPDLRLNGMMIKDDPSFLGFIRKLISEGASIILPLRDVPEQDIPYWMTAPLNTCQFTDDMGIKISHLIPGSEEGKWRWASSTVLMNNNRDELGDVTGHRFLCPAGMELEEYEPFVVQHPEVRVVQENGTSLTYNVLSVNSDLPIYIEKSNVLLTSAIISRLKFVADSYKLALYSLTEGLFDEKEIEYSNSGKRYESMATGRNMKLHTPTPVTKKTASAMLDFMLKALKCEVTPQEENAFLKTYPHYQVYMSIVKTQIQMFYSQDTTKKQKFRAYKALKNVEAYFNLLLQECRHSVMFDNEAYLFNLWTTNQNFKSDIPNYKVNISGGGGTWHPNYTYY